jgi:hypothetical protein
MQTKTWLIIPVIVSAPLAFLNAIEYKIPDHVSECSGILFSCSSFTQKTGEDHVPILGTVSLWFNNKKNHTVHYSIDGLHPKELNRKFKTLKLSETLKSGELIQGFIEDYGVADSYPYTMKIYLECSLKSICNDK